MFSVFRSLKSKSLETRKIPAETLSRRKEKLDSGKTTLAKTFKANVYFDFENPQDWEKFRNPLLAVERLSGLVVFDEIQRMPELSPVLRHIVDTRRNLKFLILGSASRDIIRQSSESLAGRITYHPKLSSWALSSASIVLCMSASCSSSFKA